MSEMIPILIIDSSYSDSRLMATLLLKNGYKPITVENIRKAQEEIMRLPYMAMIVTSLKFQDGTARELIKWLKSEGFSYPVIAIVDNLNGADILDVMIDGGAVNVIQRAAINKQFIGIVHKYVKPENIVFQHDNTLIPRRSNSFHEIMKSVERIATTNANCILFGESGMGKEQIARQMYIQSSRTQKPLTILDAGGAALVEKHNPESGYSEIYNRIEGYFQKAKEGTIILKNIQLLSFDKQSVLLHILEQEHPNVRIICTASPSLLKMVADGTFRDNLFFILRQTSITIPPLRETTEDISDIADYLLTKYAQKKQQLKKHLDTSAIKILRLHPWPGNVRELKDKILFAAFHVDGDTITADDIKLEDIIPEFAEDLSHRNPKAEKERIIKAFKRAGTWRGAAKLLGISEKSLIQLRKKHGINSDGEIEA